MSDRFIAYSAAESEWGVENILDAAFQSCIDGKAVGLLPLVSLYFYWSLVFFWPSPDALFQKMHKKPTSRHRCLRMPSPMLMVDHNPLGERWRLHARSLRVSLDFSRWGPAGMRELPWTSGSRCSFQGHQKQGTDRSLRPYCLVKKEMINIDKNKFQVLWIKGRLFQR